MKQGNTIIMSREQYIQIRAEWRKNYKNLSSQIRALKLEIQKRMRINEDSSGPQSGLPSFRERATSMLEERKIQKEEARQAYLMDKQS